MSDTVWESTPGGGLRTELFGGGIVLEVTEEPNGSFQPWVTIGDQRHRLDSLYTNKVSACREAATHLAEMVFNEAKDIVRNTVKLVVKVS